MKKLLYLFLLISILGCKNKINPPSLDSVEISTSTSALIVGVEDGIFGKCTGSLLDANNMYKLLSNYTKNIIILTNNLATANNFINSFNSMTNSELVILYYSGHGGSHYFNSDKFEVDNNDEYLCLYDSGLLDDNIWNLINKCIGRVFLIFDCCHSETMYRDPGLMLSKYTKLLKGTSNINMLCWSGCPDDSYSYGSTTGGKFTNALLDYFNPNKSYEYIWNKLDNNKSLNSYQDIRCTLLGNFDINQLIFK